SLGLPSQKTVRAQAARIFLDGHFEEWDDLAPIHTDPAADSPAGAIDLTRLWIANDETRLYLRFELGLEILIQEGNQLTLHLDTDGNPATGIPVHGIGAELSWAFGQRGGVFRSGSASVQIPHTPLGMVTAPTVSGAVFEVSLDRNALPDGQTPLFAEDTFQLVLEDLSGGDVLPDAGTAVSYTFQSTGTLPPPPTVSMARQNPSDIRVLSYNVERDGVFTAPRTDSFNRLLRAIDPDIIGFQEISSHSAAQTLTLVETALPSQPGQNWHAARIEPDLVVVSRYPVRQSFSIPGGRSGDANSAFLLDLRSQWGTDLLLLVAHPPCCRNDADRQLDFDAMMAFVRDAKQPGCLELPDRSPIIIVGDMNMVGLRRQLTTLLEGDIVNTSLFGQALGPDWDDSPLADLAPAHVALPMNYTWYNESSSFHPGRLDFIVYTDSVLEPGSNYVLFTPPMDPATLNALGLEAGDATMASDHLPVVGDFRYAVGTEIGRNDTRLPVSYSLDANYPNPFRASTRITYAVPSDQHVRLTVYDSLGRRVTTLVDAQKTAGRHTVIGEAAGEPSGAYYYRLDGAGRTGLRAMLLIR
ncbi:endonuclease/exonuclease/phosphatase family protein, partial [Rhodothermus sp. AH-315-K08]|nr:endonuclease/exonuclease/phosphatase family protein [Rhodothermus sp. AH-315-K08]